MIDLEIDTRLQILRITSTSDVFTVDEVQEVNATVKEQAQHSAAKFGRIRILLDVREAKVQSREASDASIDMAQLLRDDGDRYAVVHSSELMKLQSRRVFGADPRLKFFSSVREAEDWLTQ